MKRNINKKIGATLLTAAVMTGAFAIPAVKAADTQNTPSISYRAHVQDLSWRPWVSDGATAGTTGRFLQLEALQVKIENCENVSLQFDVHIQDIGWKYGLTQDDVIGTTGRGLRMEAIKINSTGLHEKGYKLQYRAHIQDLGWSNWVDEGVVAGTTGRRLQLEAVEIRMVKDVNAVEVTREALNDSLVTYKAALSTIKTELTQKGYDKLAKQIDEAMNKISESESVEEMEKIYEEVMESIKKACPNIDEVMAKVTTDLEDAKKLAMEILDNYEKVLPTVEGLTDYDVETIKTLIDNAKKAVDNARTAEEATKAKDDFVKLMNTDALYSNLVSEVANANQLAEAQEALIKELNIYQEALEDMPTSEISNTMKKVISDKIDMYKEDAMNAKNAKEINGDVATSTRGIKDDFNDFIANYPNLVEKVSDTLLQNAIDEAVKKLTPYLTYKNDENIDEETGLGDVGTMADQAITNIKNCTTPAEVKAIVDPLFTENNPLDTTNSIVDKVKDIENGIKANYDAYIKAYNAAIEEIDEYVAYAKKLGLSLEDQKAMDSLVKNTKGNLSIAQTAANVDKYMNLFRDSMAQYSSELAEYATEQVRADAIATLKSYENDKKEDPTVIAKATELRTNIEAKNSKGKYVINTSNEIKAELKKLDAVINTVEIRKAKENAVNEFKVYLEKDETGNYKYKENIRSAANTGIDTISTKTYTTVEDVKDDFKKLMEEVEKALVANNQSAQQLLDSKIKDAQKIIDEYIDIAKKAKVNSTILNGLNAYRAVITEAENVTTVNNKVDEVEDYINGTIIRAIDTAVDTLKAGDYITNHSPAYTEVDETTPAIVDEINAQAEIIKTTTDITKVDKALDNAKNAVLALADKIDGLEVERAKAIEESKANGGKKDGLNAIYGYDDTKEDGGLTNARLLQLYNSFKAEINAVNLNNYKAVKNPTTGDITEDNFTKILARAKDAKDSTATVKGIAYVANSLEKTTYTTANTETFDVTGGKITVTYNDNSTTTIDMTPDMISEFTNTAAGPSKIKVTYGGQTTQIDITIVAPTV